MKKKLLMVLTLLCALFMVAGICACNSVDVPVEKLNLEVGDTYSVKVYGEYADYNYISQNDNIVTVDAYGIARAVGVGQTELIIKNKDTEVLKYQITVTKNTYVAPEDDKEEDIYSLTLDKNDVTMYVGGTVKINYTVYKNSEIVDEIPEVVFTNENTTFINKDVISGKIILTALSIGKTDIEITIGKFSANCKVAVYNTTAEQLSAPKITYLSDKLLSWKAVENADCYQVSFDYGQTYNEIVGLQCEVPSQLNPVAIQIKATSDNVDFIESKVAFIEDSCYHICNGSDINLCYGQSLTGKQGNVTYESKSLEVSVRVGSGNYIISDDLIQYSVLNNQLIDFADGVVRAKEFGTTKISAYIDGKKLTESNLNVGIPITCVADLEELAFAAKNGRESLWENGNFYFLTNDIVYTGETLHERYLVPIAARPITWSEGLQSYTSTFYYKETRWGIFGNINPNAKSFCATIDGNGHSIKNAVIPYGTQLGVCLPNATPESTTARCTIGNNFIGRLGAYGALKNIRFEDLVFETYDKIDTYMYSTENNIYLDATIWDKYQHFNEGVLDIKSIVGKNGGEWSKCNNSIGAGLVGTMQNATIENVYIETTIVNNSRNVGENSNPATCGVIVGTVLKDSKQYNDSVIKNCVVETAISKSYGVENSTDTKFGGGMGAIAGSSFTGKQSTLTDNFVITIPEATNLLKPVASDGFYARFQRASSMYTNCKVYSSAQAFESDNKSLIYQITCWNWETEK